MVHDLNVERASAEAFVDRWVGDWNAHNLEAILSHFSDDVVFTSPAAVQLLGGDGVVKGKESLRRYWAEGIRRVPDLRFEVVGFYVGVDVLVINYKNQRGGLVCEFLRFDGPLVKEGHGTYLVDTPNPTGVSAV